MANRMNIICMLLQGTSKSPVPIGRKLLFLSIRPLSLCQKLSATYTASSFSCTARLIFCMTIFSSHSKSLLPMSFADCDRQAFYPALTTPSAQELDKHP